MKKEIKVIIIIVFSVFLSSFTFYAYQVFFAPNILNRKNDQETYIHIKEGTEFKTLLRSLHDQQIISDGLSFAFVAKLMNYQDNVKSGRYLLKPGMKNPEVVRYLRRGEGEPVKVTFNNVRLKEELPDKVCVSLQAEEEDFRELLNDSTYLAGFGFDTRSVMTMFIPDTYEMYWQTDAEGLFERLYREHQKFWNEERKAKAEKLGLSPEEVYILASIVDAETQYNEEKPRVAGVYLNRLEKGMLLQADPTLVFALKDFSIRRVLDNHKEIDSPYNTYKHRGLPPGPIRMASVSAIEAVLSPEQHDYLYFCAKPDFSGHHVFAKTHAQHSRNANAYHKALREKKIFN